MTAKAYWWLNDANWERVCRTAYETVRNETAQDSVMPPYDDLSSSQQRHFRRYIKAAVDEIMRLELEQS